MNQPYNQFNRSPLSATPVSIGIILVCAIAYLTRFQPLALALWPLESGYFSPWQLISYAFLHGNFRPGAGNGSSFITSPALLVPP